MCFCIMFAALCELNWNCLWNFLNCSQTCFLYQHIYRVLNELHPNSVYFNCLCSWCAPVLLFSELHIDLLSKWAVAIHDRESKGNVRASHLAMTSLSFLIRECRKVTLGYPKCLPVGIFLNQACKLSDKKLALHNFLCKKYATQAHWINVTVATCLKITLCCYLQVSQHFQSEIFSE